MCWKPKPPGWAENRQRNLCVVSTECSSVHLHSPEPLAPLITMLARLAQAYFSRPTGAELCWHKPPDMADKTIYISFSINNIMSTRKYSPSPAKYCQLRSLPECIQVLVSPTLGASRRRLFSAISDALSGFGIGIMQCKAFEVSTGKARAAVVPGGSRSSV